MRYVEKQCLAGVETLAQSLAYRMDNMQTPATAPWKLPRDIFALAILDV